MREWESELGKGMFWWVIRMQVGNRLRSSVTSLHEKRTWIQIFFNCVVSWQEKVCRKINEWELTWSIFYASQYSIHSIGRENEIQRERNTERLCMQWKSLFIIKTSRISSNFSFIKVSLFIRPSNDFTFHNFRILVWKQSCWAYFTHWFIKFFVLKIEFLTKDFLRIPVFRHVKKLYQKERHGKVVSKGTKVTVFENRVTSVESTDVCFECCS